MTLNGSKSKSKEDFRAQVRQESNPTVSEASDSCHRHAEVLTICELGQ